MIALTVVSETKTTLTVGWTPVVGAAGYEFLVDGTRVSNTWEATRSSVKFGKPDTGEHTYSVVVLGKTDEGDLAWPAVTPPPSKLLTGAYWPSQSDWPTIKGIGYDFATITINPGNASTVDQACDAADAAGLKLILGLWPLPYSGTPGNPASMGISAAGKVSLQAMHARASSILALYVFNEPYWTNPLTGATNSCGNFTAADLRTLRTLIQDVYPEAKVYHDIGSPSAWAPGGTFHSEYPCIGDKYADQTGVADYVGLWDFPFQTNGYQKQRSLETLARESAYAINSMGAIPVWDAQGSASPPDNLVMPTAVQLADYNEAIRAALPKGSIINWYVWANQYTDFLKNHPDLWPLTIQTAPE